MYLLNTKKCLYTSIQTPGFSERNLRGGPYAYPASQAAQRGHARYSVYLVYYYKSTNTDTWRCSRPGAGDGGEVTLWGWRNGVPLILGCKKELGKTKKKEAAEKAKTKAKERRTTSGGAGETRGFRGRKEEEEEEQKESESV
jgi:hypothetical protein